MRPSKYISEEERRERRREQNRIAKQRQRTVSNNVSNNSVSNNVSNNLRTETVEDNNVSNNVSNNDDTSKNCAKCEMCEDIKNKYNILVKQYSALQKKLNSLLEEEEDITPPRKTIGCINKYGLRFSYRRKGE